MTTLELQEDDRAPQIVYGETAHLVGIPTEDENVLQMIVSSATWKTDDEMEFQDVSGDAYVTHDKLIFLCSTTKTHSVSIDAECIQLHAQSEDCGIYLQVQDFSNFDEVLEFSMTLASRSDCEAFFEAVSLLVSTHPDKDEEEDFEMGDGNYGEEMVMHQPLNDTRLQNQTSEEPTDEERNAMLNRLDDLLVVPLDLEISNEEDEGNINGGQFDDAEVDELI
mmetsp:Transcript_3930/g.5999  ORF Transcript_3930/g.5999 Transcript_3930/m.5999 type:complete len:222 (+) Transcript_3930:65-730(+)